MLNINCHIKDDFYRYKMPKLSIKVESHGAKTLLQNFETIATAIAVPTSLLLGFLRSQLGTQGQVKHQVFTLRGEQNIDQLQKLIFDYIDAFVLCQNCSNPETHLHHTRSKLYQCCAACGADDPLRHLHSFAASVLKHYTHTPPLKNKTAVVSAPASVVSAPASVVSAPASVVSAPASVVSAMTLVVSTTALASLNNLLSQWNPANIVLSIQHILADHQRVLTGNSKIQSLFLLLLEPYFVQHKLSAKTIQKILYFLYNYDLVTEDCYLKWHPEKIELEVLPFLTWLKTAEEQSSESEMND